MITESMSTLMGLEQSSPHRPSWKKGCPTIAEDLQFCVEKMCFKICRKIGPKDREKVQLCWIHPFFYRETRPKPPWSAIFLGPKKKHEQEWLTNFDSSRLVSQNQFIELSHSIQQLLMCKTLKSWVFLLHVSSCGHLSAICVSKACKSITSWWLNHPSEKNARQIGWSFPQVGVKIKHVWNHHLENLRQVTPLTLLKRPFRPASVPDATGARQHFHGVWHLHHHHHPLWHEWCPNAMTLLYLWYQNRCRFDACWHKTLEVFLNYAISALVWSDWSDLFYSTNADYFGMVH